MQCTCQRKAHGTELHALHVLQFGDRLLEPTKGLRRHRPVEESNDVSADGCIDLCMELLATTVFVPREQHVRVHAEGRARPKQSQGILLAVVVDDHTMSAVERALGHCIQYGEGRHHGSRWQHFDLELPAGHVVHLLGEVEGVFMENILGRPGGLPTPAYRHLRLDDCRKLTAAAPAATAAVFKNLRRDTFSSFFFSWTFLLINYLLLMYLT